MGLNACDEKNVLSAAYRQAALVYREMVSALGKAVGAAAFSDYEFAYRKVDKVRAIVIRARENLEKHIKAHGCNTW